MDESWFRVEVEGNALIAHGEIDIATVGILGAALRGASHSTVVLDLAGVTFMDAAGLGLIARTRTEMSARGHDLEIRNARGVVRRLFAAAELDHLLST